MTDAETNSASPQAFHSRDLAEKKIHKPSRVARAIASGVILQYCCVQMTRGTQNVCNIYLFTVSVGLYLLLV